MNVQPQIHTTYLGIRISPELKSELDSFAKRAGATTTEVVRRALRHYFQLAKASTSKR